jgi:deazaflavin-dependent oxidoreductase (nitroreductase family)
MSNASSAAMFNSDSGKSFLEAHRHQYLTSGGREGHIIDLAASGGRPFTTHLLLKYVGRKSGKTYINPLFYGITGGEVVIIASKGGADQHPFWFTNLTARDTVEFQISTQAFRGTWRLAEGAERDAVWKFMVGNNPSYNDYQSTTKRQIPVVLLKAKESIPVFTLADAD